MKNKLRELTKEELNHYKNSGYLTVGDLKKFLIENNLPDDAIVVTQRIEDIYFKNNKSVYLKKGDEYYYAEQFNKDIKSGEYKKEHPNVLNRYIKPKTKKELKETMEQYYPVWCCVSYKDDNDILFFDSHY
jgi:hypothetical protein